MGRVTGPEGVGNDHTTRPATLAQALPPPLYLRKGYTACDFIHLTSRTARPSCGLPSPIVSMVRLARPLGSPHSCLGQMSPNQCKAGRLGRGTP